MLLSGHGNPTLVSRGVNRIAEARAKLPPELREAVLAPVATGAFGGLSYAVWDRHRPVSSNRYIFAAQKRILAPKLFDWLLAVCRATAAEPASKKHMEKSFVAPLEFAALDKRQSKALRRAAERAIDRIETGIWSPLTSVQHADFWFGNVLTPARRVRSAPGFFVIDWAGAKISGYPVIDALRLAQSCGAGPARIGSELRRYSQSLRCGVEDCVGYALAALGDLGRNLEHFPEARYIELCDDVFTRLESAVAA